MWNSCRYADDFLILTNGSKATTEGLEDGNLGTSSTRLGLTLFARRKRSLPMSDDGLDFLGFHIQRRPKRSDPRQKKALYVTPTERNIQRYRGQSPRDAGDDAWGCGEQNPRGQPRDTRMGQLLKPRAVHSMQTKA